MTDQFIGEIRMFAGNFAPSGWMFCNGQSLQISEYEALFSLLSFTYGGSYSQGVFSLPDLRGRIPIGEGQGAMRSYSQGMPWGMEGVNLTTEQMPLHNHPMIARNSAASTNEPGNRVLGNPGPNEFYEPVTPNTNITSLNIDTIQPVGGNQIHSNLMPTLGINYIISSVGIYPERQ